MLWNFTFCSNATKFANKLPIIYQSLVKGTKYKGHVFYKSFYSSPKNAFKVGNSRNIKNEVGSDVNTNIQNNVILYKCRDNSDYIKLRIFFLGAMCFHILIGTSTFDSKYLSNWNKCTSLKSYFQENGVNCLFFTYALIAGPLITAFAYFANQRFIKYIILHKGGKMVSILTNHAYKSNHIITVPVNKVKTTMCRSIEQKYLSLKIKGYTFYFFVDGHGTYLNGPLFDYTIGIKKPW